MKTKTHSKAIWALLLCAAMVMSMIPATVLQVNATDVPDGSHYFDFSTFAPTISTTVPTTTGWWVTADANATWQESAGNVKVKDLRYYMIDADKITEDYTVEFKYQVPSGSSAMLKLGNGNAYGNSQVVLNLTGGDSVTGDRIKPENQSGSQIFGGEGEWHAVTLAVSITNKTYQMYVDGEQRTFNSGADKDFPFYTNTIAELNRITFTSTNGDLLIDDFKLYLGEPDVEEEPTPVKYDVTFNLNGAEGTAPTAIQVEAGKPYGTLPSAPTREGYIFGGWFLTEACDGEAVDASTLVTESHTLYAKWTKEPTEPEEPEESTENSDNFSTFAPLISTTVPTTTGWWVTADGNATWQESAGNVKVKDLRYYMIDADKITEDYTVEFKYQVPSGSSAMLKLGNGNAYSNSQVVLNLTGGDSATGDRIKPENQSGSQIFGGEGEWHAVTLAVNITNKTYQMYVDGEQRTFNSGADKDFPFYTNTIAELNRITFSSTNGDLLIDDFKLYLGEPEIEEPEDPTDTELWTVVHQAALGENIHMSFFGTVTSDSGITSVKASIGGASVTDEDMSDGFEVILPLAAAQMKEDITLEGLNENGTAVITKTYTVAEYLDKVKESDEATYGAIVDHTLNYGTAADAYFNKTTYTAPDGLVLSEVPEPEGDEPVAGECTGLIAKSATLLFKDKVEIRYSFELAAGGNIADYAFSLDGAPVTPVLSGDRYYVYSSGINPQMYETDVELTVTKGEQTLTVTYSPMDYMSRMKDNANMAALVKAMYNYYLAAITYLANPNG